MKHILSLTFLFCIIFNIAFSQSKIELEIHLIEPDAIAEATLVQEEFLSFAKEANEVVEKELSKEKGNKDVLIFISFHKDDEVSFSLSSRPVLEDVNPEKIIKALYKIKAPKVKITDYSYAIMAHINEGSSEDVAFVPTPIAPYEIRMREYSQLGLKEKYEYLKSWASDELIPVLVHFETNVDPGFEGVLNFGAILGKGTYKKEGVASSTSNNYNYWRANMEMTKNNQLIPFSKVCMHLSLGEIDKASNLFSLLDAFSAEGTFPYDMSETMSMKIGMFKEELGKEIDKGIALHDKGEFEKAIAIYGNLLKDFPHSAWLKYELYFSKVAMIEDVDEGNKMWTASKDGIYECDPLYTIYSRAQSGSDGYQIYLRGKLKTFFKTEGQFKEDLLEYAEVNMELNNFDFAAQLYWIIVSSFSKDEEEMKSNMARYLYCLDKLDVAGIDEMFKIDTEKEFSAIDELLKEKKESNAMYNAFEKK